MQEQGKAATRWLRGANSQPIPEILASDGAATSSAEEGFQQLAAFWSTIWNREVAIPQLEEIQQQIAAQQWRLPFPDEDWVPTVADFASSAQKSAGSAAGCDGWNGTELAAMPTEIFEVFLTLVRRWCSKGAWPSVWNDVRQVYLRKNPGFGPVFAKDLRPIAVLSIWYRTLLSALTRRPSMQNKLASCGCAASLPWRLERPLSYHGSGISPSGTGKWSCGIGIGLQEMLRHAASGAGVGASANPSMA